MTMRNEKPHKNPLKIQILEKSNISARSPSNCLKNPYCFLKKNIKIKVHFFCLGNTLKKSIFLSIGPHFLNNLISFFNPWRNMLNYPHEKSMKIALKIHNKLYKLFYMLVFKFQKKSLDYCVIGPWKSALWNWSLCHLMLKKYFLKGPLWYSIFLSNSP